MIIPDFIVKSSRHSKKNYFFSEGLSDFCSSLTVSSQVPLLFYSFGDVLPLL
jgi:hypothetical protein